MVRGILIRSIHCVLLLGITLVFPFGLLAGAQTFYIALDGDDSWSGTLEEPDAGATDGPFATLAGARDRLRFLRATSQLVAPVQVWIRGGTYRLDDRVVFGPVDSGTAAMPVTFEAYPGETPVFNGGVQVTGWVQEGSLWTAQVPPMPGGVWPFTSLWVNGERRTPARTPNPTNEAGDYPTDNDFHFAAGQLTEPDGMGGTLPSSTRFQYRPGDLQSWASLPDAHLVIFHAWSTSLLPILSLDSANQIVEFAGPSRYDFGRWRSDQRYYIEHLLEALDEPGEWYVARSTGKLYYMPLPGEDMATADVVAPLAKKLLTLSGNPAAGQFVEYLTFRGLQFSYTNFELPPTGISDSQSGISVEAAFSATGARYCTIDRCNFTHLGNSAVWLHKGCQDNTVSHCEFFDLGASAVKIGEAGDPAVPDEAALRNRVDNNFIHDGGRLIREAAAVWIGRSSFNSVTRNDISDFRYTGISVGWKWGYDTSAAHDNLIEGNRVYFIGKGQLNDMGAIYTLGVSPGTVVRRNFVHDVQSNPRLYGGWGLYADEGSSNILFEDNIVYNTESGSFHQHYGQDNILRNNIFAYAHTYQLKRTLNEPGSSFDAQRNIIYFNNGQLLDNLWDDNNFFFDYNVYWDTSGRPLDFAGRTWLEWQADGMDLNSKYQDPLFANPQGANFSLLPGSPAFGIGFQPINVAQTGLYGEQYWIDKPGQIMREPFEPPDRSTIHEDFETTAVGSVALDATTIGEEPGASIRVTSETAHSGSRSLKFVDVPGLSKYFYPYLAYQPILHEGEARGRVSLRFTPGAILYYEWRDDHVPYRAGPSVWIDAAGNLKVGGQVIMALPADTWIAFTVTCLLGSEADGLFQLAVSVDDAPPIYFNDLPCANPEFDRIDWLGIASDADAAQVFYVDDIHLDPLPPKGTGLPLRPWSWAAATIALLMAMLFIRRAQKSTVKPSSEPLR